MSEKINIAELLENCPKGMELYSPIFGKVYLDKVRPNLGVVVTTDKGQGKKEKFLYDGRYGMNGECMLFPSKDKTTWEGFQRPFMDGDVLFVDCSDEEEDKMYQYIFILNNPELHGKWYSYCHLYGAGCFYFYSEETYLTDDEYHPRFATEEEKKKLFDAIKKHGYKWNADSKTLEELPNPKFKVGDEYELVPDKFDISTLKPFESKVLVRHNKDNKWCGSFFSHIDGNLHSHCYKYVTTAGKSYPMCIPYEGNEHLIGTTDDCIEYYKTW